MPGRDRDAVQVLSHDHRSVEGGRCLLGELLTVAVLVALREVGLPLGTLARVEQQ